MYKGSYKVQALVPEFKVLESDRYYTTEAEAQREIELVKRVRPTAQVEPLFCLGRQLTHMFNADMNAPRPLPGGRFETNFSPLNPYFPGLREKP